MSQSHITRYNVMPIPPIDAHTTWIDAGAVRIGVEYRLLNDAIAAAAELAKASGQERGLTTDLDDRGVSLHVAGEQDGQQREFLRFDCFDEDPHYHYVSWRDGTNEMIHLDPVADGDPLAWALGRIRTRLAPMLVRAGAPELAARLELAAIEKIMPILTEIAYRERTSDPAEGNRAGAGAGAGAEERGIR